MDAILAGFIQTLDVKYVNIILAVVAVASALNAFLPKPKEGTVYWYVMQGVSWLALNVKNAKNAQ